MLILSTVNKNELNNNIEVKNMVAAILSAVPAIEIYLFGSFATGTANEESDYDFYVVIPDGDLRAIEATWKITSAMRNRHRSVDMLVGKKSTFDKRKTSLGLIENEVIRTGVKLYG